MNDICGLECELGEGGLTSLLLYLSKKRYNYYIPWCLLANHHEVRNLVDSTQDLKLLSEYCIWELKLQCHEHGTAYSDIHSLDDFWRSTCNCLLLYFDCGYLELYVKNMDNLQDLWGYLSSISAENLKIKTVGNDCRTILDV